MIKIRVVGAWNDKYPETGHGIYLYFFYTVHCKKRNVGSFDLRHKSRVVLLTTNTIPRPAGAFCRRMAVVGERIHRRTKALKLRLYVTCIVHMSWMTND